MRLPRALDHQLVKADISLRNHVEITSLSGASHYFYQSRQLIQVLGSKSRQSVTDSEALEGEADRDEYLLDLLRGHTENFSSSVWIGDYQPFLFQLPEGFPNGCPAHPHLPGNLGFNQPIASL
jgi:hypothetical protein